MADVDAAIATQLANIQKKTGKSLAELGRILTATSFVKHTELLAFAKKDLDLGHGDANMLVLHIRNADVPKPDDPLDAIYAGPKAALRPIHDKFLAALAAFGPFEIAPKKANVSLRRKKQFALIGPATNSRVEIGFNMPTLDDGPRLEAVPPGGMCPYRVKVTAVEEIDKELLDWARRAYDSAG